MAARKPAAPSSKSTAIVSWDEKLAAKAKIAAKTEESVSTGSFVSLKSGVMSYNGNPVPGNALDVVVVDSIMENHFFDGPYDPNTPQSPICYAFGRDEDEMAPHEKSSDPQSKTCSECPHNQWGSDPQGGRGKACKNVRRLALIPADTIEDPDTIEDAQVAFLKVPVTSVKAWAGYVQKLAAANKPPLAYVTTISVAPDAKSQFKVSFNAAAKIEDGEVLGELLSKADVVEQTIAFPYQEAQQAPQQARGGRQPARGVARAAPAKAAAPGRARKF